MNWLVKWYWFESIDNDNTIIKNKTLKLCDTEEEAYKIIIDLLLHGPSYGWFRAEKMVK